jgi:hypothetical protein
MPTQSDNPRPPQAPAPTAILIATRATIFLLAATCALAVLPNGAVGGQTRCPPSGVRIVRSNTSAVVYRRTETIGNFRGPVLWACTRPAGRAVQIGPNEECSSSPQEGECFGAGNLALAGTIVAYSFTESGSTSTGPGLEQDWVLARDLRSGKLLFKVPSGTPVAPEPGQVGVGSVYGVEALANGTVAWLVKDEEIRCEEFQPCPRWQIHVRSRTGQKIIAHGVIRPGSLRLHGPTLTWKQSGRRRSYRLH